MIKLDWPGHACDGQIFEAEKTWRGYSIIGMRPDDPDEPVAEEYRRFYQLIPHERGIPA